jgi:AAA15 family ATPase/GTPase
MKITKLDIKKFRHIENQSIKIGEKLTIISGQNGAGKTSILGWLAQSCDFKRTDKTIIGEDFKTKYSKIFRFSPIHDKESDYVSTLHYVTTENQEKTLEISKLKDRNRLDVGHTDRKNRKKLDIPVIYLGLKRLFPLAAEDETNTIKTFDAGITKEEANLFGKWSEKILINTPKIKSECITSNNKDAMMIKTNTYDHLGNSAGQDNIGQILSALLSFKRLSKQDNFQGGLLLIDEVDATLYAGTQIELIERLYRSAEDYNIQIIFTTHSLEILEYTYEKLNENVKINYLTIQDNNAINEVNPSIKKVINRIKNQIGKEIIEEKIQIICEDKFAKSWCKNLLNGTNIKKQVKIDCIPTSGETLLELAKSGIGIFKKVIFVVDGDKRNSNKIPKNVVFLPLNKSPESVLINFIKKLNDSDDFWIESDNTNLTKEYVKSRHNWNNSKKLLQEKNLKPLFGNGNSRLCNRWKKDNKDEVDEFQKNIKTVFKKIYNNK